MNEQTLTEIKGWMAKGIRGLKLAEKYTAYVDDIVSAVFAESCKDQNLLLLATGGYGRRELAPFSDIDIMFFAEDRTNSGAVEDVLYRLWDSKMDISHAFRTPKECLHEAFSDIRTRTALLEARYLAGSRRLYDYYRKEIYPAIAFRKQKQFISEKLIEKEKRHGSTGDSVYLLEPHIKEGDGGLRDLHTVLWLSRVAHRVEDFHGLSALLQSHELKRLLDAYNFIVQTRYCLHLASGRRNDILSFEYQRAVAECLGFKDSKKFSGPERMLRYYYLKARIVRDTARQIAAGCSRPYMQIFRDFTKKKINDDFSISGGMIIAPDEGLFKRSPEKIMEAFYHYSQTGRKFSSRLRRSIQENLLRINRRTRNSSSASNHFLEIVRGKRVYETLREMHETGVLGRFFPEFGALRSLVVHEPYHTYTVDEHTLLAIRNMEKLRTITVKSLEPLKDIMSGLAMLDVLFLALLFHDIGKAAGRHHEEEGYRRLKSIMERLNIQAGLRMRIEFLVRNHIMMSRIAMTREIDDPEVVALFADAVEDVENLKAICLITYADMSAVNPDFWNAWKASLLLELYERTVIYLSEGRFSQKRDVGSWMHGTVKPGPGYKRFVDEMPERYLISTTDSRKKADFDLYENAVAEGAAVRVDLLPDGMAEINVSAPDSPGLFSRIIGFLSLRRLNIVHGKLFTGKHGFVIDKIAVSNWKDVWWKGLEEEVTCGLSDVLIRRQDIELASPVRKSHGLFRAFAEIDNESSASFTLIEIFSQDRHGLLYDVSRVLYEGGADIMSARINTESGVAQDTFYVTHRGAKLESEMTCNILKELWNILEN